MAWQLPPSSLFLAAGQAVQLSITFGDAWVGPQFFTAKEDQQSGGDPEAIKILVIQWQGTAKIPAGFNPPKWQYYYGIANNNNSDIWFHIEGGAVT